ncbi:MAG TPA: hypothetical protein VFQ25_06510 [Ktedonobacterales bacterium]|nr:hypothetical protein [Ktedonobacterales bacterium]
MTASDSLEIIQSVRERRLITLGLADQVAEERWREAILPGGRTAHAMLAHLLAWDEWLTAVLELSALRPLPEKLKQPLRDVDAFNGRSIVRFDGLPRQDLLMGLQGASVRLVSALTASGGGWASRRIPDLAPSRTRPDGQPSRGPSVGGLLRTLREHEREHDEEFSAVFGVTVDLEQLREQARERGG